MAVHGLLVVPQPFADVRVGGIAISERWRRAFALRGAPLHVVGSADISTALRSVPAEAGVVLVWANRVLDSISFDDLFDFAALSDGDEVLGMDHPQLGPAPAFYFGPRARDALLALPSAVVNAGPHEVTARLRAHARFRAIAFTIAWWGEANTAREGDEATWSLLKRLRWRQGGFIAHYLNRPVSMWMSRYLVNTPLTPNQTTWITFVVGVIGTLILYVPGYATALLGMALMHVNSVLDGIDGELARLRYQRSEYGAWLDSICDEILNTAVVIGAGYNVSQAAHGGHPLYLWLGLLGGVGSIVYAGVHWHCKIVHGKGFYWWFDAFKPRKDVQRSTSAFAYFKRMFQKDGLLFLFFVFAIVGALEPMLWVAAIGSTAVLVLLFIHIAVKRAPW